MSDVEYFGFYNINKPAGPTSHDIVAQVRRQLSGQLGRKVKVGHTGTLDPFASGVLVIAIGPATRLADYVQAAPKRYAATVTLGATSTTDDVTGDITPAPATDAPGDAPTREQIEAALRQFVGTIMQCPPAYSAVHVDGKRAYKLARKGEQVAPPARPVTVHDIRLVACDYPTVELDVLCGAGTYIRALARDLGAALGVGGYCSGLVRTAVGEFTVAAARDVDHLDAAGDLASPMTALAGMPVWVVGADLITPLRQGKMLAVGELARGGAAAGMGAGVGEGEEDKEGEGEGEETPNGQADDESAARGRGGDERGGEVALVGEDGQLLALGRMADDGRAVHPRKVFAVG